jgi:eukaryotic-like serine/threonine-protein kinase
MAHEGRDIPREKWPRVEELLDMLLDGQEPEAVLGLEPDPEIRAAAMRLWVNDQRAAREGFLNEPITLVGRLTAAAEPCFAQGQVLIARFRIERLLGAGGMGEVYLALDDRLRERVAIKTVRRDLASDAAVCRRFVAEVQNARRVTHPNVCRINELFDDGATPFLSMEYLEGPPLSEWLRDAAPPRTVGRRLALDLAEGLAAAHRSGIVHGDFKPSNVILAGAPETMRAVITDFGLARAFHSRQETPPGAEAPSNRSLRAGTLRYMAPELWEGAAPTVRSDIYAFGRVLDELLPGHSLVAQCTASRAEQRPASLDPVLHSLGGGLTRRGLWLAGMGMAAAGLGAYGLFSRPRFVLASR